VFDVDDSNKEGAIEQPNKSPPESVSVPTQSNLTSARKRGMETYLSSTPDAKKKKAAVVTPPTSKDPPEYVPTHIHKNIDYRRRGKSKLSANTIKTFQLIEANFTIPMDFEQNRSYGPQSGTSYEERVIQAYTLDKLSPKDSSTEGAVSICTHCANMDHKRDGCPDLL
jgi:hypothetical protein